MCQIARRKGLSRLTRIKIEKKRAKESESSEMKPEKKLKKEDSGKETGDASREDQKAQATTPPKPGEKESKDEQLAKSSVETKKNVAASKIDTGRARDRLPTPGRNYDAVKDPKARDNLPDPSLPQHMADKKQKEIDNFPRRKGPKPSALSSLELVRDAYLNPDENFHGLYICHAKGPGAPPTYDEQGFELDYDKVCRWMKPTSVRSLKPTMSKMKKEDEYMAKKKEEERKMADMFYEPGAAPEEVDIQQVDFWKDAVSKDLGVPWHHIGLKHFEERNDKGFEKAKKGEYDCFSEEENNRMTDMHCGSALRV